MTRLFFALIASAIVSSLSSFAETPAGPSKGFGQQDERGAYQEVRVSPFQLTSAYFEESERQKLEEMKADQKKYDIYYDGQDGNNWGRWVSIYFQNGQLVSTRTDGAFYPTLNLKEEYCHVKAVVSFDSPEQLSSEVYSVSGVVTLVGGSSFAGSFSANGTVSDDFRQGVQMDYKTTGAYNHRHGTAFNEFGNGKNDTGRILAVGCTTFSLDRITVSTLQRALGARVSVVYP